MFNLMKEHYKKLNGLINLKPRSNENKNKRLKVMSHAGNIYNKLYNIYRSKCNQKIDSLSAKDKKKLDYKQLKIIGDYRYSPDEEQEEEEQEEQEEQEKQEDKQEEKQKEESEESRFLEYIENKSKGISYLLFNYYFDFKQPSDLAE